ncbi:hypothetical protein NDU88_001606 [Pleurodeles waltl]|uniref:Uncharacterized protein n=1 Tax=Pleurodeles waltl TaxID=8319 RepID=A0AAV7U6V4_PLEWA|nr:hypothetical protein NDU88_001606 [Pleurodeles waltl]
MVNPGELDISGASSGRGRLLCTGRRWGAAGCVPGGVRSALLFLPTLQLGGSGSGVGWSTKCQEAVWMLSIGSEVCDDEGAHGAPGRLMR